MKLKSLIQFVPETTHHLIINFDKKKKEFWLNQLQTSNIIITRETTALL